MEVALALLLCVALAHGATAFEPITLFYHENVGIPEAARIKVQEEALLAGGGKNIRNSPTSLGQYPYYAGLLITLQSGNTSVCGGSLLSNTRVLTAAHCWFDGRQNASEVLVVLGSNLLFSGGTRVSSSNVQVHANFNANNLNNDVAIISISHVGYTNSIQNIPIATGFNNYAWTNAIASGIGRTNDSIEGFDVANTRIWNNQILSHVTLPVITNSMCAQTYGPKIVVASTLCIDGASSGSVCDSDSGGPLATSSTPRVLIGVMSFGSLFCFLGFPAGFARVSSFASWIQAKL